MPSTAWQTLGRAKLVGHLRADLKRATASMVIVGPWIDDFFAAMVCDLLPAAVALRVVTRPPEGQGSGFDEHALAARRRLQERPNTSVRLLSGLHAKVLVIDERLAWCGSANWYRYSLEQGREIILRGPLSVARGLLDELELIWEQASERALPRAQDPCLQTNTADGCDREVMDPIAAAKLKQVPGSFVLRGKRPRR